MAIDLDFEHFDFSAAAIRAIDRTPHSNNTKVEVVTLQSIGSNLWVFRTSEGVEGVGSLKTAKDRGIILEATNYVSFPISNEVRNRLFAGSSVNL